MCMESDLQMFSFLEIHDRVRWSDSNIYIFLRMMNFHRGR